eukprot:8847783-Alexandrium_andersonii.AAC.1
MALIGVFLAVACSSPPQLSVSCSQCPVVRCVRAVRCLPVVRCERAARGLFAGFHMRKHSATGIVSGVRCVRCAAG